MKVRAKRNTTYSDDIKELIFDVKPYDAYNYVILEGAYSGCKITIRDFEEVFNFKDDINRILEL